MLAPEPPQVLTPTELAIVTSADTFTRVAGVGKARARGDQVRQHGVVLDGINVLARDACMADVLERLARYPAQ